ncbi:MAG: BtpA/SgcQ family protein, partial [bacterium]|nr:BtpA/SgcQ family protein [bacterium]
MDTEKFFHNTPIFAMLHLAGGNPLRQALEELTIFEEEGVDGVIVENYHADVRCVEETLRTIQKRETKLEVGVNVLPNNYNMAFSFANKYGCSFIQLDYVAGSYTRAVDGIDLGKYISAKGNTLTFTLGGVWPKYYTPVLGSDLEKDLRKGMERAEAIVVTGEGTGMKTPMDKIQKFRKVLGDYPLVIGAGLTPKNAREQLL